jgi:hypothetical protein
MQIGLGEARCVLVTVAVPTKRESSASDRP